MMKEGLRPVLLQVQNGIVQGRTRPNHQVRIQLPVVDSSTQTEDSYVSSPIKVPASSSIPIFVHPKRFHQSSHFHDGGYLNLSHPLQQMPLSDSTSPPPPPCIPITSTSTTPATSFSMGAEKEGMVEASPNVICANSSSHHDKVCFKAGGLRRQTSEISSYVLALRPWSFPASITPVALGSCLAYKSQGAFDIAIFLTTIMTALCVHAAGNLVNTYFDFVRGIDNKKSDDRTIVDKILSLNDVATLGAVFYIAGCIGFMFLNFLSPAKMEHLALIYFCGLSSSFLYTGGLGLKYIALGDILIVLTFGPLTVVFSHLSQTGHLSLTPLIYAIPLALNTEAILHCNNARDMDVDKQAGIMTLAIVIGKTGSYLLFCLLLFLPYLIFITIGIHYSSCMLLPAASIILAFRLEKQFRRRELENMPQRVALLNLILGLLYIISILISDSTTLPTMTFL